WMLAVVAADLHQDRVHIARERGESRQQARAGNGDPGGQQQAASRLPVPAPQQAPDQQAQQYQRQARELAPGVQLVVLDQDRPQRPAVEVDVAGDPPPQSAHQQRAGPAQQRGGACPQRQQPGDPQQGDGVEAEDLHERGEGAVQQGIDHGLEAAVPQLDRGQQLVPEQYQQAAADQVVAPLRPVGGAGLRYEGHGQGDAEDDEEQRG